MRASDVRRRVTGSGLEDYCSDPNQWLPLESFEEEFLPEIWRDPPAEALAAGHGGGDYFEVMDFVDAGAGAQAACDRYSRGHGHDAAGSGQPGVDPSCRRVVGCARFAAVVGVGCPTLRYNV